MNKKSLFFGFVAFMCAALIFTGCPQEADDDTEETAGTWLTAGSVFKLVAVEGSRARLSVKSGDTFGAAKLYDVPAAPLAVLQAVYDANAPASTDSVETGKKAVDYTADISGKVLKLFQFTTGTGDNSGNIVKVEITGDDLPATSIADPAASATNLIVIDIGRPDEDNSALPKFYIPIQGLGAIDGSYPHIRLRVNSGANLVILADNRAYAASGAGRAAPDGYFNGGCVEVMSGGKLRDGAFEGFPLGSNAVILNRSGSYLSVGAEERGSGTNPTVDSYNAHYKDYLLAPSTETSARIVWDTGNTADSYLEVRPGVIATSAKLKLQKSVGLIYSVWFVGDAALTIDAKNDGATWWKVSDTLTLHGLLANEVTDGTDFNFYANTDKTVITIKPGSTLDKRFLTETAANAGADSFIINADAATTDIEIKGKNTGTSVPYVDSSTGISGYLIEYTASTGGGGTQ